ncbi:U-box domain-containing protein 12-like [Miscanthus floridulus]|uniref:U-box domain-containing protein 12-like n=1 Tax=Miscanthus floridulus TaxID=154761 RepID=UPI003457FFF2
MVARCAHADAGGFRIWPIFSAAALRRKVLEVLTCGGGAGGGDGGGGSSCRGRTAYRSPQRMPRPRPRSDRLAELLRAEEPSECSDEAEAEAAADVAARKVEAFEELKGVVGALQDGGEGGGGCMSRVEAAKAVRRKAKDDAGAREMVAMLGAIPPLVAMVDEGGDAAEDITTAALYALLNLGIGNDTNKAAIVQAGAVHKMLRIAEGGGASGALTEAVVANFLCLSALDANKPVIGASGAAPFLVRAFQAAACCSTEQARHDALRALLNLSIAPANAPHLLAAGLAPALVAAVGDAAPVTDRALAVLCNLVAACPEGRRAVSRAPDAVPSLVDALNWTDEPGCQEKAAYVLMVLAHRSYGDRAAMVEAGASSALLELTLVGTALAQKRASRILEILRADKGKQVADDASGVVATVSAPQERRCRGEEESMDGEFADAGMSAEKRAVRQLVQQSLQSNMRRIVRRARLPQDFAPASTESLKALTASSTSKSLPF